MEKIEPQSTPNLNIWVVPGEQVFNESEVVKQKVNSLNNENTALRLTSEAYNFSIDETKVQMIIGNDYTQYTFKVDRPILTRNLLENYICKVFNDGGIIQYLVSYPFTENENGIIYNDHGSLVKVIDDDNLLGNIQGYNLPIGCEPELISVTWSYQCTNYPCTGAGHEYGEHGCHCNGSNCEPAYRSCGWVSTHFYGCGGGGSGGGPGSGGEPGSGQSLSHDQLLTVPFDSEIEEIETPCEILKKQSEDNIEIKKKIDSLRQRVLTSIPNHDTHETKVNVKRLDGEYHFHISNDSNTANGVITVTGTLSQFDVARIHNHPVNSLPVFSHIDIVSHFKAYNFVYPSRKNEFTDYLVCFNNTTYALRIENPQALATLFQGLDLNTPQGREEAEKKVLQIFNDYGLNTEQEYTQEMAEKLFMDVIYDGVFGTGSSINLYRKDSDGWGKMVKNDNTITKEPCTN